MSRRMVSTNFWDHLYSDSTQMCYNKPYALSQGIHPWHGKGLGPFQPYDCFTQCQIWVENGWVKLLSSFKSSSLEEVCRSSGSQLQDYNCCKNSYKNITAANLPTQVDLDHRRTNLHTGYLVTKEIPWHMSLPQAPPESLPAIFLTRGFPGSTCKDWQYSWYFSPLFFSFACCSAK